MNNENILNNKVVLITGGTGSFGRNFAKFLIKNYKIKKVIVFSRDEFKQHEMQIDMAKAVKDEKIRFFIGDIRDLPRLYRAFNEVDIVVHAAALKQVPTLEYNPLEAVKTNIIGSQNVIEAAIDQNVPKVLLISSDKAVQPINLYGATKLCAEKLFISANSYSPNKTLFSAVRYGNVVGSRGSIVETLMKNNKKVKITDKNMTRFWMSLNESFDLVVYALENMEGGEIFIPKVPSMKLVDLFDVFDPKPRRRASGIRPGEKLHEILLTEDESRQTLEVDGKYVILPAFSSRGGLYEKYYKKGQKLDNEFKYTSDQNKYWLTKIDFKKKIKKLKIT